MTVTCSGCGAIWPEKMRFCGECGLPLTRRDTASRDGEMRILSILFADIVGSTPLSAELDPEEFRDVIRSAHRAWHEAINRHGGHIVRFIGDGVLALFGMPPVVENGAVRAVDAAVELVAATTQTITSGGQVLQARAAVHTGEVVVAAMGAGEAMLDVDVVGEAANVSARLQSEAAPGEVIVSSATAELVDGYFTLASIGPLALRGVADPVDAHLVGQRTDAADRLSARARSGLTPFVGRPAELSVIRAHSGAADLGRARLVVITGEAGMGKSRLAHEALQLPTIATARRLVLRGAPDQSGTPFAPVLTAAQRDTSGPLALGLADELVALMSGSEVAPRVDVRRRVIDELVEWLRRESESSLVVLLAEDIQWMDASTLDAIGALHAADDGRLRLLTLCTARTPWNLPWGDLDNVSTLSVGPLSVTECAELLTSFGFAVGSGGDNRFSSLIDRAEGVPLYLEEICALAARSPSAAERALPLTIAEVLSTRLAASDEQQTATDCSVLGNDIDVHVAASMLATDYDALRTRFDTLVASGIMRPDADRRTYSFRHRLIREAAYGTLLRSDRRRLHAAAADALELHAPTRHEQIARHLAAAGDVLPAAQRWLDAARAAADRSSYVEGLESARSGLDILAALDEVSSRLLEADLARQGARCAYYVHGGASEQRLELQRRASLVVEQTIEDGTRDPMQRLIAANQAAGYFLSLPDFDRLRDVMAITFEIVEELGLDTRSLLLGTALDALFTGDLERAESCFLDVIGDEQLLRLRTGSAHDVRVLCLAWLAHIAADRDDTEALDGHLSAAYRRLADAPDPFNAAWLHMTAACIHALVDDRDRALDAARAGLMIATDRRFGQIEPQCVALRAWADQQTADDDRVNDITSALAAIDAGGSRTNSSLHRYLLVDLLLSLGRIDEAHAALREAEEYVRVTNERHHRRVIERVTRSAAAFSSSPDQ